LVAASDDAISKIVAALKDTFKVEIIAPGHCTGEPTFAALKQAFGDHYIRSDGLAAPVRQAEHPG
jgi:7,8-dihydropterin-6-yl-methyl-4-(beta-D-ribofuranosyl)aminobenzene 5'-phosphate synthase